MANRQRIIATIAIIILLAIVFIKIGQSASSTGRAFGFGGVNPCVAVPLGDGTLDCIDPYAPHAPAKS